MESHIMVKATPKIIRQEFIREDGLNMRMYEAINFEDPEPELDDKEWRRKYGEYGTDKEWREKHNNTEYTYKVIIRHPEIRSHLREGNYIYSSLESVKQSLYKLRMKYKGGAIMKPYKTIDKNIEVMNSVKITNEYLMSHPNSSRKYMSNDEFTLDICNICNIPYETGKRVTWFIRADGDRDAKALAEWGFNRHKIPKIYFETSWLDGVTSGEPAFWGFDSKEELVDWWYSDDFNGPSNDDELVGCYIDQKKIDVPETFGELMEQFKKDISLEEEEEKE